MRDKKSSELAPLQIELREAMGQWGCPLCRLSLKAERAFIDSLNYERVLDLKTRDDLKAARGLCEDHSRMWQQVQGSALGVAIVYRVAVLDLLRDTEPEAARRGTFLRPRSGAVEVAERLAPSEPCPACEIGRSTVARFADLLLNDIQEHETQSLLLASGGLCLPHLRITLERRGAGRGYEVLMAVQREAWQRLIDELDEFIRKNDYRFTDEIMTEDEGTAWSRALDVIVGLPDTAP